jgi:hypothetical protein
VSWYDIAGWIGTFGVLFVYARMPSRFNLANAVLWPLVIAPAAIRGAWSAAAITFAFGVLGTIHTIRKAQT